MLFRNGNFDGYKSNRKNGYSSYNKKSDYDDYSSYNKKYNNDDYSDDSYRRKRQYGSEIAQDTSSYQVNRQASLPKAFQAGYNPSQTTSYGSMGQQKPRLAPMIATQRQIEMPSQPMRQPEFQCKSQTEYSCWLTIVFSTH